MMDNDTRTVSPMVSGSDSLREANPQKKNAVLTAALGYGAADLAPLVCSLAQSGFNGELVVFASSLKPDAYDLLRSRGATLVEFDYPPLNGIRAAAKYWRLWRLLFRLPAPENWKDVLAKRVLHHTYLRFLLYRDFLRRHRGAYGSVFLTDSRDVVFQGDPFAQGVPTGVHVFFEDPKLKIGDCPYHRKWFNDCYGGKILEDLSAKLRVCSGTVIGDAESIADYLDVMRRGIFQVEHMNTSGGDQAIHSRLFYDGKIPQVQAHPLGEGIVLTLGNARFDRLVFNARGSVLNKEGQVAPVLHQYDRVPELMKKFAEEFSS